jgi:hypothetical protein
LPPPLGAGRLGHLQQVLPEHRGEPDAQSCLGRRDLRFRVADEGGEPPVVLLNQALGRVADDELRVRGNAVSPRFLTAMIDAASFPPYLWSGSWLLAPVTTRVSTKTASVLAWSFPPSI